MLFTKTLSTLAAACVAIMVPATMALPHSGEETTSAAVSRDLVAEALPIDYDDSFEQAGSSANAGEMSVMADDFRVRWSGSNGCGSRLGPVRGYSRGNCIALSSTTLDVLVVDHVQGCKMRGYRDGNCSGGSITAFSTHQCHDLKGVWSVRIGC